MSGSDTYNDSRPSWTAHIETDTEEPAIKLESDTLDGAFELLAQAHPDCRFDPQIAIGSKRKREQGGMDQVYSTSDAQYLNYPAKGEDVDEATVKGEPVTMNQPDAVVQESATIQEADEDATADEHYCRGRNDNIPTDTRFIQYVFRNHSEEGIKSVHCKPDIDDPDNVCNACERRFETRAGYVAHLRRTHHFNTQNVDQQQFESSTKTSYYCCGCNQYMKDQVSFRKHVLTAHCESRIKHFHLKPDVNDPNWYCNACERHFASRLQYTGHLRAIHKLIRITMLENVDQLEAEPNHYCCGCNKYLPDGRALKRHIKTAHSKTKIRHFSLKPDVHDPNYYCKACERRYGTRLLFKKHLRLTHKMVLAQPTQNQLPIPVMSSPTEPVYYCNACNLSIKEYMNYLTHIRSHHSKLGIKHITAKPDIYEPNYYCKACEMAYSSKRKYRTHLRSIHNITVRKITAQIPAVNTTESEYYCSACNTTVFDYSTYVAHITTQHPRSRIKHFHVKPDIHDPNYYCSACEKTYPSKSSYKSHFTVIHNILVDSKQNEQQHPTSTYFIAGDHSNPVSNKIEAHSSISGHDSLLLQSADATKIAAPSDALQTALDMGTAPEQQERGGNGKMRTDLHKAKNYCHYCEMQCEDQDKFRTHLRELHNFITTRSRGIIFNTSLPKSKPVAFPTKKKSLLPPLEHFKPFGKKRSKIKPQGTSKLPNLNSNSNDYKCDVCNSLFKYKSALRQHLTSVHQMQLVPIRYKRNPKVILRVFHKRSKYNKQQAA
ncbi:uncharacterized protein ATC70_007128 [Mucor velutinosus]|uniref:C2H2-type domain-containing protein n=1 Tax=Mucor velutinosus TaxID=708070 RepID=A0AAN7HJX2_9FUNG|nr:hypothetical protein ATC70_007128 [Mucor velutinosus]